MALQASAELYVGGFEKPMATKAVSETPKTGRPKIVYLGFAVYANQYLDAFCHVGQDSPFNPVRYYLCCHALELALKAYLLKQGQKLSTLRTKKVGHNLEELLNRAANKSLVPPFTVDTACVDEVKKANRYYFEKGFEYFELVDALKGRDQLPDLFTLERLTRELLRMVLPQ